MKQKRWLETLNINCQQDTNIIFILPHNPKVISKKNSFSIFLAGYLFESFEHLAEDELLVPDMYVYVVNEMNELPS